MRALAEWVQLWFARRDRAGLAVVLGGLLLYLPGAGGYGLWDPWETHYGEVARQMTTRGDYISLWWPGSPRETATFQTKPVLSFWLMSLSLRAAGLGLPGGPPEEMALGTSAEWALRTPFCLFGVLGLWAIYFVTARLAGRRAGVLAALVTATFPMYALIARQAMTDMVYVGLMSLALALLTLVLEPRPDPVPARPGHRLLAAALLALATVPQLLVDSIDLRVAVPWGDRRVVMYGIVVMAPYWIALAGVFVYLARVRRVDLLALIAAATLAGLAVLGKGLAGLALPVVIALAFIAVRGSWRRFADRQLWFAQAVAVLVVAIVAVPWHHAMYVRHGAPWWNELFGDNHWRRLMIGRHGDRGTFGYFLRELGYGALPWLALAAAAVGRAVTGADAGRRTAVTLGVVWFVTAYFVVSMSMTKFHHYLLPALPGLGIVIGCALDDLSRARHRALVLGAVCGRPLVATVAHDLLAVQDGAERFLWLFSYDYVHSRVGRPWPPELDFRAGLAALAAGAALASLALVWPRTRRAAVGGLGAVALATTIFLLDHFMPRVAHHWSQKETIARYYRERRGPDERLIAYFMFWRGETFYTKNAIYEGPEDERTLFDYWSDADERLKRWLAAHRGQRHFFVFTHGHEGRLRALLPPEVAPTFRIIERSNNKFSLASADF